VVLFDTEELGIGKGVRGRSEMDPSDVDKKVGDGVELGIGNGVRGKSEMDPREVEIEDVLEMEELVATGTEELDDGVIIPLLLAADVIAVLPCIVNALLPSVYRT
jgi:hypothetical protein